MKISEVIKKVNSLYPHPFEEDKEQMVLWCNEVTAMLSEQLIPKFSSCVQTFTGKLALPEGVEYSDVEKVYANGVLLDKLDERSNIPSSLIVGDVVKIVYKEKPHLANLEEESENYYEKAETACPFPHDLMYVDFLCAQIAFHQNDLSDYNKFILSYNQRLADFEKVVVDKLPKQPENKFKNLW